MILRNAWLCSAAILMASCTNANFGGEGSNKPAERPKKTPGKNGQASGSDDLQADSQTQFVPSSNAIQGNNDKPEMGTLPGDTSIQTENGETKVRPCSAPLDVPGTANPWFSGVATSAVYRYSRAKHCTDTFSQDAPPQVTFTHQYCLQDDARLYFNISGQISHGGETSGADGGTMTWLDPSNRYGKSTIQAPINSLLGVFLDDNDPTPQAEPPALVFATTESREQKEQKPLLRQVFFIGDGKTSTGEYQRVVVPKGAKRFFFAIMDSYEWCNNTGVLTGNVMWEPAP